MRPSLAAPAAATVALTVALTAALTVASTGVAQAAQSGPADGRYYVQSAATGLNAAASQDTVVQHRPKGDEDHQQWSAHLDGDAYLLENADEAGRCLGRGPAQAALVLCTDPAARWQVTPVDADRFQLKDPQTERYLAETAGVDQLALGPDGGTAVWYFTPVTAPAIGLPAPGDRRLDQVTFLTAHNAFANGVDGAFAPPFINLFPNQDRGISQQLADGVRGFMLDIYESSGGAVLCHQSCLFVSHPVALSTDLNRIVDFLRQHPAEFVTVFLEDYVAPDILRAELARVPGLADVLYRPDQDGVRANGWPTMGQLAQRGKRLLVFTDHSRASDEAAGLTRDSFGVMYQRDWTVENYWSMGSGTGTSDWSCYSRWGTDSPLTRTEPGFHPLFVMNHFRDTPVAPTVATDNSKILDRATRFCEPAARKKPTFLAVDRYETGNPMAAVDQLNMSGYEPSAS